MLALWIGACVASSLLFWWYYRVSYWRRWGVPSLQASLPLGNIADMLLMRKTAGELHRDIYRAFPEAGACGFYRFTTPCLVLRDPELVKTVMVKEFPKFRNNEFTVSFDLDPLMALNPFTIKNEAWKPTRAIQLPMQTPNKVRSMCPDILRCGEVLGDFVKNNPGKEFEAKQLASKYTGDSVAVCAFGLESNSFQDDDSFGDAAKGEVFASSFWDNLAVLSAMIAPTLAKILRLRVIRKDFNDYFVNTVKQAAQHRLKNNLRRNDFLQQLIDTNMKGDKPGYSDIELAAHCMTFYMDGYETTGIAIAWALWELGVNMEVQERLREEIRSVGSKLEDFTDHSKLPYLDAVISETLRLHPPIQSVSRLCNEETELDLGTGRPVRVPVGSTLVVPILALHTDPAHFSRPEVFDPERFLRPDSFHRFAYIPYGEGPRICVGMKFALLQMKTALISVLLDHRVESKHNKVSIDPSSTFLHNPLGGLWVTFLPDKKNV